MIARFAARGIPLRHVVSRRVTFLPRGRISHRLKFGNRCHSIIAVSEFVRELLVRSGIPQSRIELIPDGIEIPVQLPSAESRLKSRERWGAAPDEFLIGHAGAFTHEKGQDIALEAALRLSTQIPQARMLLAGDGPLRSSRALHRRVRDAQGRVRLLGYVDDLSAFMSGLDLFIMPSRAEGLGSAALIAMAHGVAVIASRVGGLPEIVQEGKTGWLVPADSSSALAEAMAAAYSHRARLAEFGVNARERARQFSVDIMVERTESLYRRLLGRCGKA
jgi:glycosyltransferase involved in cell wall biosynthesis